jgi:acyl dehydratase
MGEVTAQPVNPRGIFDRSTVGMKTRPVSYPVEKGRIAFFCDVVGETNPIHFDEAAARRAGFPTIVAPPTFPMVIDLETLNAAPRLGFTPVFAMVRCDLRYLLHGSERYEYSGHLLAGDEITITHEVLGFEDKKGGALEFCHVRGSLTHPERGEVVAIRRTFVHRLG